MELVIPINPILALLVLILIALRVYDAFMILVWQPFVLTRRFKEQGISGPKYRILYGNLGEIKKIKRESQLSILDPSSNDVFRRVLPHYQQWMSLYGAVFSISLLVHLYVLAYRGWCVTHKLSMVYIIRRDISLLERNRAEDMHLRSWTC